jgi:hypothetical protein
VETPRINCYDTAKFHRILQECCRVSSARDGDRLTAHSATSPGLSTSGMSVLRTNYVSDNGWVWSWNRIRWNRQKTIFSSTTSSIISTLKICRPRRAHKIWLLCYRLALLSDGRCLMQPIAPDWQRNLPANSGEIMTTIST